MSKFEKSEWAEDKHAKEFMENADIYIQERQRLFKVIKSFYRYFIGNKAIKRSVNVLDLGCGDGALTRELLKEDQKIEATLIDGSAEMLKNAKEHLKSYEGFNFIQKTFQELLEDESKGNRIINEEFDFVISSLAIHHLHTEEKKSLFRYIYDHLNSSWYRVLWGEWIQENQMKLGVRESFEFLPEQYKNNPDNHPDTLTTQLNALKTVGFQQVDCYYKYGIFTIFGGKNRKSVEYYF